MALRHPLFVSGAAGGVTSPQDARLALAAFLTGPGVMNGFTVTGSTSGPNMQYAIAAGVAVTQRGTLAADGLYVVPNDGPVTVDSGSPAPASGTRWDLVWVRCLNAYDGGFGDANSDPVFGVTVGTAGSTPTKPYASVPAGALVLAESNVGTSIANASLATISMVAATVQVGGDVNFLRNRPLFIGYQATSQGIPTQSSAWTPVAIDTTVIDSYSGHSNTTNNSRYTAQVAGWYRVAGVVYWPGNATGSRQAAIAVNGAVQGYLQTAGPGFSVVSTTATPAGLVYLAAGQYVELWASQNSGSTLSLLGSASGLNVEWDHA